MICWWNLYPLADTRATTIQPHGKPRRKKDKQLPPLGDFDMDEPDERSPGKQPLASSTSLPALHLQGSQQVSSTGFFSTGRPTGQFTKSLAEALEKGSVQQQRQVTPLTKAPAMGSLRKKSSFGKRGLALPYLPNNDWEQDDEVRIEATRRRMFALNGCSKPADMGRPMSRSAPDLHAPSQGRLPSRGGGLHSSHGRSPSNHTSLPSVIGGHNTFTRQQTPDHNSSSKGSSSGPPLIPNDPGSPHGFGRQATPGQGGTPSHRNSLSGSPHRSTKQEGASENSLEKSPQHVLKTPCPSEMDGWTKAVPQLNQIAKQWGIPFEDLTQSNALFCEYATKSTYQSNRQFILRDGRVSMDDFHKILCRLSDSPDLASLPEGMKEDSEAVIDHAKSGWIDFWEFAVWHESMAFAEYLVLDKAERNVRSVGRKLGISTGDMDRYTTLYRKFDLDVSGLIEYSEFGELMNLLMKPGPGLHIPEKRIEHFWGEADLNGNGKLDLEEFVTFYSRHFDISATDPLMSFYNGFLPSTVKC